MELQTEQPSRTLKKRKTTILLVDDDINLAESVSAVLEGKGYEVVACENGLDGLERLRAGVSPDLILLDLMMPEMNGWQFRIEQRKRSEWAAIPVIAFSGDESPQAAAIDAIAYLKKPVEASALLSVVEDVLVDVRQQCEEARRSELERLSSLGLLAAGIAHEINNPLALTFGNLDLARNQLRLLQSEVEGRPRARVLAVARQLDDAQHGAQRIAEIVRSVAAYTRTRPTDDAVTLVEVVQILESSIELVGHELSHRARLVRDYRAAPQVLASAGNLTQAFLNLLTHAMHGADQSLSDHPEVRVSVMKSQDGDAIITVEDDGPEMSPAELARLFEPFYFNESRSAAPGFGLAISHRIFNAMGAQLTAETVGPRGLKLRVQLQAVPGEGSSLREGRAQKNAPQRAGQDPRGCRPRVFVIDDEPLMCDMLAATLDDEYEVRTFTSARVALTAILAGEAFDVLVCDLMMPDFSGVDLYRELVRHRSDLAERMIFMTGGAFTEQAEDFMAELGSEYLMKPFQPATVSSLIQKRLRVLAATAQPN